MKNLELTQEELNEITAKIANELETYGDQATKNLKSGFLKLVEAGLTTSTLLIDKFKKQLIEEVIYFTGSRRWKKKEVKKYFSNKVTKENLDILVNMLSCKETGASILSVFQENKELYLSVEEDKFIKVTLKNK